MSLDLHIARLKGRGWDWPIPWPAVEILARKESCVLTAYLCPAGVWTIGWGETEGVVRGMVWTADQADARLRQQVIRYAAAVRGMCRVNTTQNQLGALVLLSYNIGLQALRGSSVLRLHNAGDPEGAARAFRLWDKARVNGRLQPLRGLTIRRAQEAALYLTPETEEEEEPTAQAVESESRLIGSPIAQGGFVTTAGGGGLGMLALVDTAQQTTGVVDQGVGTLARVRHELGVDPTVLLLTLVVVGAGAWVLRWRIRQRREGWA